MFRKVAFASITGLSLITSCVATNDDDGEDTGGSSGMAGARGGSSGASGASPSAGKAGGVGGSGGVVGGSPGAGTAGMPAEGGDGGTTTEPQAGAGGTPSNSAGAGGTGAIGTAGDGGAPVIEGGTGGAAVIEGGSGGEGGDGTGPLPEGGMGGMGGMGGEGNDSVGLVVHYEFDENTGTTSVDSTGRFADATLADGATFVPGRAGTSGVELSAATAHVVLAPLLFEGVERATIATWVNMAEYLPWSRVFDIPGTNGGIFMASDRGTGPTDGLTFRLPHNGADALVETDIDLPLDVWKHVAVTIDGPTYSMFVDGYPIATAQTNAWMPSQIEPTISGWLGKSGHPLDQYLKATLDDFRVYDEVLPQNEIADLAWPDSDYSYFRFDETSGTVVGDSSDRAFDGTLRNGVTFTEGKVGGAIQLNPAALNYVSLPPRIVAECDDLTIALWARMNATPAWARFLEIDGLVNGFIYFTPTAMPSGTQLLRFTITGPPDSDVEAPLPAGMVGGWHHFAVTLAGDMARLYVDGVEIGSNPNFVKDPSDITVTGAGAAAVLGRSIAYPNDQYLNSAIDDLRISCRAFTADEIKALAQ